MSLSDSAVSQTWSCCSCCCSAAAIYMRFLCIKALTLQHSACAMALGCVYWHVTQSNGCCYDVEMVHGADFAVALAAWWQHSCRTETVLLLMQMTVQCQPTAAPALSAHTPCLSHSLAVEEMVHTTPAIPALCSAQTYLHICNGWPS